MFFVRPSVVCFVMSAIWHVGRRELGHEVGIVCDSTTGGDYADNLLDELKPFCKLGMERRPISRLPGFGDLAGARAVKEVAARITTRCSARSWCKRRRLCAACCARLGNTLILHAAWRQLAHPASWPMQIGLSTVQKNISGRIGTGLYVCVRL